MNTYSNKGKIRQLCNATLENVYIKQYKTAKQSPISNRSEVPRKYKVVENVMKLSSENQY